MQNRNKYAENWEDTIRPDILKRDNYRCGKCGLEHRGLYLFQEDGKIIKIDKEEYLEALRSGEVVKKIFLQVAHLDHTPTNNEYWNLLSLCPKCHLNNDRDVNNIKKKARFNKN